MRNNSQEIWKNIPGFENLYQISNLGEIKSLKTNKILKKTLNANGYYCCTLITEDKKCPYVIHRLIALTFIENPNRLPVVHHKNHIKTDNQVENLEWTTRKENSKLAAKNGRYKKNYIKKKKFVNRLTNDLVPKHYTENISLEKEFWIDIKDFENCYQISNYGRVKSKTRKINGLSRCGLEYEKYITSQFIKPSFSRDAYLRVNLRRDGNFKGFFIHQLVACHFLDNPNNYIHINHLDSNPMNNHVSNLEWITIQKNNEHARIHGNWNERGENSTHSKLTNSQVISIRENKENKSISQLSRDFGVTRKCISNIIKRKSWKHI